MLRAFVTVCSLFTHLDTTTVGFSQPTTDAGKSFKLLLKARSPGAFTFWLDNATQQRGLILRGCATTLILALGNPKKCRDMWGIKSMPSALSLQSPNFQQFCIRATISKTSALKWYYNHLANLTSQNLMYTKYLLQRAKFVPIFTLRPTFFQHTILLKIGNVLSNIKMASALVGKSAMCTLKGYILETFYSHMASY